MQAGTRYLAMLRRRFFASSQLNERERMAFVLGILQPRPAAGAEPARRGAAARAQSPSQWFFQVERVAAERHGMGVVSYVNSINEYQLAFARERYRLEP